MYQLGAHGNPAGFVVSGAMTGNMQSGIQISQPVTIKIRINPEDDFETIATKITRILDAAGKSGFGFGMAGAMGMRFPGNINPSISYALEDTAPLQEDAMADALARANRIKESLQRQGFRIGKLINVTYDEIGTFDQGRINTAIMIGRQLNNPTASLSPDEITVESSLVVRYRLTD